MENFKVICVNDKAKPKGFIGKWVEKNKIYTVVDAKNLAKQRMTIGYKFAEIEIPEESEYKFFLANRFRPCSEDDELAATAVEELIEETLSELSLNEF